MTLGAKLGWAAAVCVAFLLGTLLGVWLGGQIEADVCVDMLTRADLPDICWDKIDRAAEGIIQEYEGDAPASD